MFEVFERTSEWAYRLARDILVVAVALLFVASAGSMGVAGAPADVASTTTETDGPIVPAADHKGNETATDDSTYRVVNHDFPMPDRATLERYEEVALGVVEANPTIESLRADSFVSGSDYRYRPDGGTVVVKTWHRQRVEGTWKTGLEVTYEEGYVAQVDVDADSGTVDDLRVSPRDSETVTKSYSPAQKEAIEAALDDASVVDTLADRDTYVAQVRSLDGDVGTTCADGCQRVLFRTVNSRANLVVTVTDGAVVETTRSNWHSKAATPDIDTSQYPDVTTADGPTATGSIDQHNWSVSYSVTTHDGVQVYNADHDGIRFLYQAQVPNIRLYYPDGTSFRQNLTSGGLDGSPTLHNYSNGFMLEGVFYEGCSAATWPQDGCNRYDLQWGFDENGWFEPWLQIHGPGTTGHDGEPMYQTRWRFDTDVEGYDNDGAGEWLGSHWGSYQNETYSNADSTTDPNGNEWQVFDTVTGQTANVSAYDPDDATFFVLNYEPVTEVHPANLNGDESVSGVDIMTYYVASSDNCNPNGTCFPGPVWKVDS